MPELDEIPGILIEESKIKNYLYNFIKPIKCTSSTLFLWYSVVRKSTEMAGKLKEKLIFLIFLSAKSAINVISFQTDIEDFY